MNLSHRETQKSLPWIPYEATTRQPMRGRKAMATHSREDSDASKSRGIVVKWEG